MRTKDQAMEQKNKGKKQPVKNDTFPRPAPVTGESKGRK